MTGTDILVFTAGNTDIENYFNLPIGPKNSLEMSVGLALHVTFIFIVFPETVKVSFCSEYILQFFWKIFSAYQKALKL